MGIIGISGLQLYQKYSMEKTNNCENSNEAASLRADRIEISKEGRRAAEIGVNSSKQTNEEYLKNLQKQVPYIKLQIGHGININNDGKVNVVDVSPKLLQKMQNDPEAAKEYTQRLKDVETAQKIADSVSKSMGHTVVCSHSYVDENGRYSNFTITVKKDLLNEKLRKEAKEKTEKWIEKSREKAAELLKEKFEKSENGEIFLDNDDIQTIIEEANANEAEPIQEKTDRDSAESDKANAKESQQQGGKVAFNAAKRARQLAAASTKDQVQIVLDLLNEDLSDCKEGLAKEMCGKDEVAAVEAMIRRAKEYMSKVSKADATDENQNLQDLAFNMASLF